MEDMSINREMDKEDVAHRLTGILLGHKNGIMPFAATYMDTEIVILNEVKSDREGEIFFAIPYIWNLKRNDTNELTCITERDS